MSDFVSPLNVILKGEFFDTRVSKGIIGSYASGETDSINLAGINDLSRMERQKKIVEYLKNKLNIKGLRIEVMNLI